MNDSFLGIIAILLGILAQFKATPAVFFKMKNAPLGVKTEVGSFAILLYRVAGILLILFGAAVLLDLGSYFFHGN